MSHADIEINIQESPVSTEVMMRDLMYASSALSTSKCLLANSKVRAVLTCVWVANIMCIVPFFVYSILKDSQADLVGLGMVVVPLYISKIIESLNKVTDKINKVYSDSESIKMRIVEIFSACEERVRKCPKEPIKHAAGKYITSLTSGILSDISICDKETRTSSLVINSFLWKNPHYTKFLDKAFVYEKSIMIISLLKCECDSQN